MRKRVVKMEPPAEAALAQAWAALPAGSALTTVEGVPVHVSYPGRAGGAAGPDFVDAVLETPQGEVRGAVELHRRTSDWERHGHGGDARYGGVVLHVVGEHDGAASRAPGGVQLPLVDWGATAAVGEWPGAAQRSFPCAPAGAARSGAAVALGAAGDARFDANVARLRERLEGVRAAGSVAGDMVAPDRSSMESIEQVVYEEVATALGYSLRRKSVPGAVTRFPTCWRCCRRREASVGENCALLALRSFVASDPTAVRARLSV